ncbi:SusE domain-containing protein [Pontibacter sp. 172403-2]|uniref:SusE domain-containing protein n=1 Tax=Pontibacter rufus TaxID=2791028 RepID=UPI0018AFD465|nr:SusE domain-containing protein [Pontibacter sp. 172403-2]MBF9254570.1 SusE domain-containing protein [Pontibacter sp. 172403-2]
MRTSIHQLLILCVCSLALFSCEKDEEKLTVTPTGIPELTVSTTSPALSSETAADDAVTFSWTPLDLTWSVPEYSYDAAKYTLQLAPAGTDFAAPEEVALGSSTEKTYTVADFNKLLLKMELPTGAPASLDVRLQTSIGPNVEPTYSNVVTVTATPYVDIPDYPSLYVPGQYQGWAPDVAPKISSPKDDGIYEGYVFMNVADGFKFTSKPNWDGPNYGDGGTGKLSTDGGAGNLTVKEPGYYLLKANTKDLTWSATKTTWGVIGDATGSWDNDKDLTYDETTKVWSATLPLSVGEIKFRANDAWDLNYGDEKDDKPADGVLEFNGDNIKVEEAGNYLITLDLSHPGYYLYKLKKQ